MPKKDFTDKRAVKKDKGDLSKLDKKSRKALKQSKKETQKALDNHRLGWTTRDGEKL